MSLGQCNPIWNYFRRNEGTATCLVCKKELSLGSIFPRNQTVSSIKKHLEKMHSQEFKEFHLMEMEYVTHKTQNVDVNKRAKRKRLKELKEAIEGPKERKKPGRKRKVEIYSKSQNIYEKAIKSIALYECDPLVMLEEKQFPTETMIKEVSVSSYETKKTTDFALNHRIDRSILNLMIVDLLPFSIVEGEAFKRLNFAEPNKPSRFTIKPADYYKSKMLPETYDLLRMKVMSYLDRAEWISLSTTHWSHPSQSCFLHIVTAHFLHENQKHIVVLRASPRSDMADSENLVDLTRSFNIAEKIHISVAREADKCSAEFFNCVDCSSELLENTINDSLLSLESMQILSRKCQSIIDHFVDNPLTGIHLNECQEICGLPQQKLSYEATDSWISIYLMWEQLFENKKALELYLQQYGEFQVPSSSDWQKIENSINLLRIFHQAWLDINSEAACASMIIPLLAMINAKLEPRECDPLDFIKLKQRVKSVLNTTFAYVHHSSFYIIATLLDPRFKMKYLTTDQTSSCHAEMTQALRISLKLQEEECMAPSFNTLPTNNYKFHNTSDLWEEHDTSTLTENNGNESALLAFEQQMSCYIKEPLIARNGNIYQYWNKSPYEYLRKLAYKYLTAPPTTLACGDTIRNVGTLYSERRMLLKDDGIDNENLLFMACNVQVFNFEY